MKSDAERCAEYATFKKIDAAFRAGDLAALRAAVGDPASVPNGPMPLTIGACLEYAIYHSPLPFIRTLLEIGADPNPALARQQLVIVGTPDRPKWLEFKCPCRCGETIALNLMKSHFPHWTVERLADDSLTVRPSIDSTNRG